MTRLFARPPKPILRRPPYNWTVWSLLYPIGHLLDGLVALISFSFVDFGFTVWIAETNLRHAANHRRLQRKEPT